MKSIKVEGGFFLWRGEFSKIGKHDFTFIRQMRVNALAKVIKDWVTLQSMTNMILIHNLQLLM